MVEPIIRDTGNFTLKVGNTTFNLIGVHFDSPDPNPTDGRQPRVETFTAPLEDDDHNLPVSAMPGTVYSQRTA